MRLASVPALLALRACRPPNCVCWCAHARGLGIHDLVLPLCLIGSLHTASDSPGAKPFYFMFASVLKYAWGPR